MNLAFRVGWQKEVDVVSKEEMTSYPITEFVSAEFSPTEVASEMAFDGNEHYGCGGMTMEWHRLSVSEPIVLRDLYDEEGETGGSDAADSKTGTGG
jgi:hypothetical protein